MKFTIKQLLRSNLHQLRVIILITCVTYQKFSKVFLNHLQKLLLKMKTCLNCGCTNVFVSFKIDLLVKQIEISLLISSKINSKANSKEIGVILLRLNLYFFHHLFLYAIQVVILLKNHTWMSIVN